VASLEAARTFVNLQGRVLEQRLFACLVDDAPAEGVLRAVGAYRNDDGGLGHGLEPDKRAPSSQPLDVSFALETLETAGADIVVATGENEPSRVRSALAALGDSGITSILLEGGPHLAGAFLDAGEIDEIRLFLAPLLIGGRAARDPLEGEGVERISDAVSALTLDCEKVADDLLISARLREW
jgi:hypothetical protein